MSPTYMANIDLVFLIDPMDHNAFYRFMYFYTDYKFKYFWTNQIMWGFILELSKSCPNFQSKESYNHGHL